MKNLSVVKCPMMAEVTLSYKSKVKAQDRPKIERSSDVFECLKSVWDQSKIEHTEESLILMLNRAQRVIGWAKVSSGGTAGTVVDPKVIFQLALLHNASAIMLSHNHPSGNLKPSFEDINLTKRIVEAGKTLDIQVLDHIIMSPENTYLSFADEGIL